jgi:hypothetical protein
MLLLRQKKRGGGAKGQMKLAAKEGAVSALEKENRNQTRTENPLEQV